MNFYRLNLLPALCILLTALISCAKSKTSSPVRVIIDTDMGSDCDDAGALALLHHYQNEGKATILGAVYSSGKVPYGAGVVEAINLAYGRTGIPVGAAHSDEVGDPVDKMGAEKLATGGQYGNRIRHNHDATEQTVLNRAILAAQPDTSIIYITIGHTKGLYDLLKSQPDEVSPLTGRELIERKVRRWVALGALGAMNPERNYVTDWNFWMNGTAAYTGYLLSHFPRPIAFVDGGDRVLTGKGLLAASPDNIVRRAYEQWLMNYEGKRIEEQRPSWDLVTIVYAVEGQGRFFRSYHGGTLEYNSERGVRWNPGESSAQVFVKQREGVDEVFAEYLNSLLAQSFAKESAE